MNQFDENFFTFKITGGTKSTDIIQAEAIILKGPQKGESLPLKCQWFNITDSNDFIEIQGLTGAFYQPSLEDVGTKIMVQAIPILESQEYEGMPVFKETGIITQDPQIQDTVTNVINKIGHFDVHCRLENTTVTQLEIPSDLLITIFEHQLLIQCMVTNKMIYHPISEHYPQIKIHKKTTNGADIILCEVQSMQVKFQNNFTRDVVYLMMKTLRGKSLIATLQIKQNPINDNSQVSELYAKVDEYTSIIQKQDIEIERLKQQLKEIKSHSIDVEKKLQSSEKKYSQISEQSQKTFESTEQKYLQLAQELVDKNSQLEKQKKRLIFLEQEVNIIKTQLVSVQICNKKLMNSNQDNPEGDNISNMMFKEKEEMLNRHINTLKEENAILKTSFEKQKLQIQEMQTSHKQEMEEQEVRQNEIQSLRKRCDSLAQEQIINKNKSETPQTPSPRSALNTPKSSRFEQRQESSESKEEDFTRQRQQIINLEQTIKSLRQAYEQDIRAKQTGVQKQNMSSSKQEVILQKLVHFVKYFKANSLAETITEKETALEHSKRINKDLMRRIQELEAQLKVK